MGNAESMMDCMPIQDVAVEWLKQGLPTVADVTQPASLAADHPDNPGAVRVPIVARLAQINADATSRVLRILASVSVVKEG
jgi:hypothetical protein